MGRPDDQLDATRAAQDAFQADIAAADAERAADAEACAEAFIAWDSATPCTGRCCVSMRAVFEAGWNAARSA